MNRKAVYLSLVALVVLFAVACGSMNKVTPAGMDNKAMEADVHSKIVEHVPGAADKVHVSADNGVVTLTGAVKNESDRRAVANAANEVKGVKTVINNVTISPQ